MATQNAIESANTPTRGRITLWHISLLLVGIGLIVSGYLSYVKLVDVPMVCAGGGVFNCDVVQNSAYSRIFNIPIAWLGFAMYITVGTLLLLQNRSEFMREFGGMLIFGVVLFAFVYSMYLVYLQFFVLQALCQWCLMHEANMTVLFVVTCFRLKNELSAPAYSE
jgi:uncharacterized membrane protein